MTHTEHDDVSDDKVSSTPCEENAADDMSNASSGPVTHSKSRGEALTAKGFVIMVQDVNWLTDSWKNVSSWFGRYQSVM